MKNLNGPKLKNICTVLILTFFSVTFSFAQAQDKTMSPYFMVYSETPNVDKMPLKSTSADVSIAGVIADVTVTQVYSNDGQNTLEAVYVFPGSTKAAVYGMEMSIGNRTIVAEVREKGKAKQAYNSAKAEGKRVSLLEQDRPNVFKMNVANILPGDEVKVVLRYTEMLIPEEGVYSFVYPTVVGPRYQSGMDKDPVESPFLKEGQKPTYDFDINVNIQGGMRLADITSPTHNVKVQHTSLKTAEINLAAGPSSKGNRDYVLNYSLAGKMVDSGLLLYEHANENFFLMTVQPPKRVLADHIPVREYIFVVDVSGSMSGFPLEVSKKLLRNLITNLNPDDKFNVLFFAGTSGMVSENSLSATEENVEKALNILENLRGGGGTELLPALQKALDFPRSTEALSRSIVVVTDGYVNVEKEAFDLIRNNLNASNLFVFGIGQSVNRHLLEGMARVGGGEAMVVIDEKMADGKAEKFRKYINSPVLTRINVTFEGFEAYDIEPTTVPDVMAERPVLVFGKYRGTPSGNITVTGFAGKEAFRKNYAVAEAVPSTQNAALRYLWARERIKLLDDFNRVDHNSNAKTEVTKIGLDYNLMTAYTSFIAIDNEVVSNGKQPVAINQPLPLPSGVSSYAVGFSPRIESVVRRSSGKKITSTSAYKLIRTDTNLTGEAETKIKTFVNDNWQSLTGCSGSINDLTPNGKKLIVHLTIASDGTVSAIKIMADGMEKNVRLCLEAMLRTWRIEDWLRKDEVSIQFEIR
ncbi:MAG: VIT and VWA domain-containing protein [Bacteroidota bacterium]